jgi:predicted nuclease of restriction endonuclease-like (RecB) superfamily
MVTPNEPTQELSIDEQRCSTHAVTDPGCDVGNARGLSRAGKVEVFPSADEYKCINMVLIFKLKDPVQRLWYGHQATANGWSRSMLEHWIESDVYSRQGEAVTNFSNALPPPQSDLAKEIVRDPYNFDFLTLREPIAERELEEGLLAHIRKFILELGAGFAFVGQQVHLVVDGEDFYIDLLFYHLKLRCYVIVDLKTTGRSTPARHPIPCLG